MSHSQSPRLAVTELQMFAHLGRAAKAGGEEKLNRENLVNPGTLAEALYDTLIYHAAIRLQPFVEMVTHSATVNHGGGLRKERERVYANPCYYAQKLFAEFAEARPVRLELQTPSEQAPLLLPDIKNAGAAGSFGAITALAARATNGDLLISLVHRGTAGPVRLTVNLDGFSPAEKATAWTLTGPAPWAVNSLETPDAIHPGRTELETRNGPLDLVVQPYSVVQIRLRPRG